MSKMMNYTSIDEQFSYIYFVSMRFFAPLHAVNQTHKYSSWLEMCSLFLLFFKAIAFT